MPLPQELAARVSKAEQGMLDAVGGFTASQAPDAEGQKALFQRLNGFTRDRSNALLEWRGAANARFKQGSKPGTPRARYQAWEAAWLPLWKSEIDITYRLQADALKASRSEKASSYVREILALQRQAAAVVTPKELQELQDLSLRRLTVLARTAEQLQRLSEGESRGALTRVRRLSKELSDLGRQMQEMRLARLSALGG